MNKAAQTKKTAVKSKSASAAKTAPATAAKRTVARPKAAEAEPKTADVKPAAAPAAKKSSAAKVASNPAATPQTAVETAVEQKAKPKKAKLVRDSFTMPEMEYQVLGDVKKACLKAGLAVKKSELLRVGVALIKTLDMNALKSALAALPPLKVGRPKNGK